MRCGRVAARLAETAWMATVRRLAVRTGAEGTCSAGSAVVGVQRWCSTTNLGRRLVYNAHGDPNEVLQLQSYDVPTLSRPDQLRVDMLAAPINPADINQVQGVYPKLPSSLPAVGGNEGVGRVAEVGPEVKSLVVGDHVIPAMSSWGTWQTTRACLEEDLIKVPKDIPVTAAAMLAVNPCTAYRMLQDFVALEPGDCVIQNGGNSAVGVAVIQLAKAMGVATISVVRDRPHLTETVDSLVSLGATKVVTDSDLAKMRARDLLGDLPKPRLGLNCVGGRKLLSLCKYMAHGSTIVTYGGMSRQPVTLPTGKLIFDDITARGFWMTRWNETHSLSERQEMLAAVSAFVRDGKLTMKCREWSIVNAKAAIAAATEEYTNTKEIFVLSGWEDCNSIKS